MSHRAVVGFHRGYESIGQLLQARGMWSLEHGAILCRSFSIVLVISTAFEQNSRLQIDIYPQLILPFEMGVGYRRISHQSIMCTGVVNEASWFRGGKWFFRYAQRGI